MTATVARVGSTAEQDLDILDRFLRVSGTVGEVKEAKSTRRPVPRDQPDRENIRKQLAKEQLAWEQLDRESIRKQLALEKEDLQICFVNDIASDDELFDDCGVDSTAAAVEIVRCNISQKAGQIIVPIYCCPPEETGIASATTHGTVSSVNGQNGHTEHDASDIGTLGDRQRLFLDQVNIHQAEARKGLLEARTKARLKLEKEKETRTLDPTLLSLLGLKSVRKLNRRILSGLSLGQLNVILNDYLAQIENLNETLVQELLKRDERVMEQDAMLTDIQDLAEFIHLKL